MNKDHHINAQEQRAKLKKEHLNMPDDIIEQGINDFNEMLDVIKDCTDQIRLCVQNAVKIGKNIDADPVIMAGILGEKLMKTAMSLQFDFHKVAVSAYTEQKAELMILKQMKSKGLFT